MTCDLSTSAPPRLNTMPKLRAVEVVPELVSGEPRFVLCDPSRISNARVVLSPAALQITALMDGEQTLEHIQHHLADELGLHVTLDQLQNLVHHLDLAFMLEGSTFETHYQELVNHYRAAPTRRMENPLNPDGETAALSDWLNKLFAKLPPVVSAGTRLLGLIVPHLDYPRGLPCYRSAYARLQTGPMPRRIVLLGTNHFGRSPAVVATAKPFETPLGISRVDVDFLEKLEAACKCSLREHEYDHQHEHSIELQIVLLQHIFGVESFQFVPLLCPDICGPTGTVPREDSGADLAELARQLRFLLDHDDTTTLIIASADLSHVGQYFGDAEPLQPEFLERVRTIDRQVLEAITHTDAAAFQQRLTSHGNSTRICSSGSIYTLLATYPDSQAALLDYHQAVTQDIQNCVTCAAVVLEAR